MKIQFTDFPAQIERLRMALAEDIGPGDVTSEALLPADKLAHAKFVSRVDGVVAGLPLIPILLQMCGAAPGMSDAIAKLMKAMKIPTAGGKTSGPEDFVIEAFAEIFTPGEEVQVRIDATNTFQIKWLTKDGKKIHAGQVLCELSGPARSILAAERVSLNLLQRLSGIASLTRQYVDAVRGTGARILDTRKTFPLWRDLEKYAVRMGGGFNHRMGLYDEIMIKDNHLGMSGLSPADAVTKARKAAPDKFLVVELDSLDPLKAVLDTRPDTVLLDNMSAELLKQAVQIRRTWAKAAGLTRGVDDLILRERQFHSAEEIATAKQGWPLFESSGGVNLETVRAKAESGVERISVGAITHSAGSLDIGLDLGGE
ncbi:MAG TPA: nicotinate-nucleotide diphosphorylase [Planctomycetota bacterium]|nr:nicotinate-nucleotide diphosphorylase [Planctomycetota bacterium]